jgi:DNA repair exonuclease SbcCD nuclease subunit
MKQIAFIADIHIGAGRAWFSDAQSENPYYLARHRECLTEILTKLRGLDPLSLVMIILGGDLLHFAKPTAKEMELLAWWLRALAEIAPVHIIAGNHEDLFGEMTVLHPFKIFMGDNKNVIWHLEFEETEEVFGKVLWVSHNQTAKLKEYLVKHTAEYIVAHYAAKGCVYDSGINAPKGWEFKYHPGKIKRWFIGDIHLRQALAPNASYPGSPLQITFGETGSKGFDLYDFDSGKLQQIILTQAAPMVTEIVKDSVPDFNPKCLYRVFASNLFLNHHYPPNVIDIQPLGSKKKDEEQERRIIQEEIDFGDPLAGFEDTLKRTKLPEPYFPEAKDVAMEIMK